MTTTPDLAPAPTSPQFQVPPLSAVPPETRDEAFRAINTRRAQVENPEMLRTIRSL